MKRTLDLLVRRLPQAEHTRRLVNRKPPGPLQESVNANDIPRIPRLRGFQRPHGHLVEPEGIGPVLGDDVVRIDHVAERFRHFRHDAFDGFAGCNLDRRFILAFLDLVDGNQRTVRSFERKTGDHPLMEETSHRFGRGDFTEVEEDLVPEAGVKKMQHGVFRATHIEIDAADVMSRRIERFLARGARSLTLGRIAIGKHPIRLRLLRRESIGVSRIAVAKVVPT